MKGSSGQRPTHRSVPCWLWELVLLLIAALIALNCGLVAATLVYLQAGGLLAALAAAATTFGATLNLALGVIRRLDRSHPVA
jgi:hypothetical protein